MFETSETEHPESSGGSVLDTVRPDTATLDRIADSLDCTKMLNWHSVECLDQFFALVHRPPLQSVVASIAPVVAEKILKIANDRNRPLEPRHSSLIGAELTEAEQEITGETIKFSLAGYMLDGQHRLDGARKANAVLTTHVIFGLSDAIFDVIDQGKKRSASDVLALCGVSHHALVAAAIRQATALQGGNPRLTNRAIRELAMGDMQEMQEFIDSAKSIAEASDFPAPMVAALLFVISRHSKDLAHQFAYEWANGARVGVNENFDALCQRMATIERSGGRVPPKVRLATTIAAFNHWNAGVIATQRTLKWRTEWPFPTLQFDKDAFIAQRKKEAEELLAELDVEQKRVLRALAQSVNPRGNIEVNMSDLAKIAGVKAARITTVIASLEREGLVDTVREGGAKGIPVWKLGAGAVSRLQQLN